MLQHICVLLYRVKKKKKAIDQEWQQMQSSKSHYKYSRDRTDARALQAEEECLEANNDICGAEEGRQQGDTK